MTQEEEIRNASPGYALWESGAHWADAHPVNPWHKVSEELPEPLTYVIVRFSNNTIAVSQRTNHFIGETTTVKVTHWMLIPEPPKVE